MTTETGDMSNVMPSSDGHTDLTTAEPLPYRSASVAGPGRAGRGPVFWSQLLIWGVTALAVAYCYAGARIAQHYTGQTVLFRAATGTDAYDRWLIDVPSRAMLYFAIGCAIVAGGLMHRREWRGACLLAIPTAFFAFFTFFIVCFPVFDEISP